MAFSLLDAATATGVGPSQELPATSDKFTVTAIMGGTVVATAVTVALEGSLDDTNFFTLASHAFIAAEITAEGAMFHIADKPVDFIRANLETLTGGTNPTVTVIYEQAYS